MDDQDSKHLDVDPIQLTLPHASQSAYEHRTDHIASALRASGLEAEVEVTLPTRGGGGALGHWAEFHDTIYTGGFRKGDVFDLDRLRWPDSLYIPRTADSFGYWLTPAPANRRYGLAWPARGGSTPNWADRDTGELFAYTIVPFTEPAGDSRTESGIGIVYSPPFSLGTVRFEPAVNVTDGMLTSALEYFPIQSAGHVTLTASVLLACWQVIPGGYDLLGYREFPIARIVRDQSYGPERHPLPGSLYTPRSFSTDFLVQGGREYVFGVVGRVAIDSTLTDTAGRPLRVASAAQFKVYAWMTLGVPYMSVEERIMYIP